VGIAVDPAHIPLDDPALHPLVRANRRALQTIVEPPRLAIDYIVSFLGRLGDRMKRFVEGRDQGQSTLSAECAEDWIDEDIRFVSLTFLSTGSG
jgi:hypothetical protein